MIAKQFGFHASAFALVNSVLRWLANKPTVRTSVKYTRFLELATSTFLTPEKAKETICQRSKAIRHCERCHYANSAQRYFVAG